MNAAEKSAVLSAALRYRQANGGVLSNGAVTVLADRFAVSRATIRRWVHTSLRETGEGVPSRGSRAPFEFGQSHLVAVRRHRSLKAAHTALWPTRQTPGWVSYATFARAFNRLPADLQAGLLGGADDMAAAQVYLSTTAPHVNHSWYMDHKQAHVWVALGRGQVTKPWVTTIRDSATGAWMACVAYRGRPNEDSICDALATAAEGHRYELDGKRVDIGGVPVQLVFDNAAEHFSSAVVTGSVLLGVVLAPTRAYEKQQNGTAESANSVIAHMERSLPGFTHAKSATLATPVTSDVPGDVDLDNLISIEQYQRHLDALVEEMNTKPVRRLGGRSRVQAWADDPTERTVLAPEAFRMMLRRESRGRVVNAEGIRFRGRDYLAPELNHYRQKGIVLKVGYLTRETRFIDVFDEKGDWICRAFDRDLLTEGQRFQVLEARKRSRQLLAEVDAIAKEDWRHESATDATAVYGDPDFDVPHEVDEGLRMVTDIHDAVHDSRVDPTHPQLLKRHKRQPAPPSTERTSSPASEAREAALLAAAKEGRRRKAEKDRLAREKAGEEL